MTKLSLHHLSPLSFQIVCAYVYSALAPVLFMYDKARHSELTWSVPGILLPTLACCLAIVGGLCFTMALQKFPVHLVVGLVSVNPIITVVLAHFFLGEPITLTRALGISLVTGGVALLAV